MLSSLMYVKNPLQQSSKSTIFAAAAATPSLVGDGVFEPSTTIEIARNRSQRFARSRISYGLTHIPYSRRAGDVPRVFNGVGVQFSQGCVLIVRWIARKIGECMIEL